MQLLQLYHQLKENTFYFFYFLSFHTQTKNKMKIPKYINCKTNTTHCEYYITKACKESCPYSQEINGLGCGAVDLEIVKGLIKKLSEDKLNLKIKK